MVQDAFLSAYRARHNYRAEAAATTWLYRIVVNAALQKIRKDRGAHATSRTDIGDIELVDHQPGPEAATLNAELGSLLEEAIGGLPEDLRAAVVLRDVQQLTNDEAAAVLDISVAAFKARLHRGRVVLRNVLAPYLDREGTGG